MAGCAPFELVGSLSKDKASQSSTAREMIGVLRILQLAASRHHALLSRAAILLIEDNQGAVAAINSFRSSAPDIHAILKEIFELCSRVDFDIIAQWKPRAELAL